MGLGMDGPVSAIAVYDAALERIVVGGSFTRVYQTSGSLKTGGVAMWDQVSQEWSLVGGGALQGVVLAIAVRGSRLFVGGRFAAVGGVEASNVALFDGNAWAALGPGKFQN
jgi:hypothetical protein